MGPCPLHVTGASQFLRPALPPSQPLNNERYTQNDWISLSPSNWVEKCPPITKLHMECLCYLNLPHLGLVKVNHPSMDMGTPITAPKQWEKPPKELDFDVTIKLGQKEPPHHKIAYVMDLSSQPTSSWFKKGVSSVYKLRSPHHSPNTMRDTP